MVFTKLVFRNVQLLASARCGLWRLSSSRCPGSDSSLAGVRRSHDGTGELRLSSRFWDYETKDFFIILTRLLIGQEKRERTILLESTFNFQIFKNRNYCICNYNCEVPYVSLSVCLSHFWLFLCFASGIFRNNQEHVLTISWRSAVHVVTISWTSAVHVVTMRQSEMGSDPDRIVTRRNSKK